MAMYMKMLPRLQAEEQLRAIETGLAYGERMLEDRARDALILTLERQRSGEAQAKKATRRTFAQMGIAVQEEPGESAPS